MSKFIEIKDRKYYDLIDNFGDCIFDGNHDGALEAERELIVHFRWYEWLLEYAIQEIKALYEDVEADYEPCPWDEIETEYLEGR